MSPDVEHPMGNTELRLTLATIQEEVADSKSIGLKNLEQFKELNGSVKSMKKWQEQVKGGTKIAVPFMVMITGIVGWLAVDYLNHREQKVPTVQEYQAAAYSAMIQAIKDSK